MNCKKAQRLAGKVIIAGFEGKDISCALQNEASAGSIAGIILFKRNIKDISQTARLIHKFKSFMPQSQRPIISLDQEGGRVIRIGPPLAQLPPARVFGQIDSTSLTKKAARLTGMELYSLGFNTNFAPVLDVDTNPDSPVIGDRSYSSSVQKVIDHGFAVADGLVSSGVMPVAKHFPGHGDVKVDTHKKPAYVSHKRKRLESIEFAPFRQWAHKNKGPIMTAHIVFPELDPDNPATFSRKILNNELREKMGFNGVIFSDDLEMGALKQFGDTGKLAVKLIKAGVNGILICKSEKLRQNVKMALAQEAIADSNFKNLLTESVNRLQSIKWPTSQTDSSDWSWIHSQQHEKLKKEVQDEINEISGDIVTAVSLKSQ